MRTLAPTLGISQSPVKRSGGGRDAAAYFEIMPEIFERHFGRGDHSDYVEVTAISHMAKAEYFSLNLILTADHGHIVLLLQMRNDLVAVHTARSDDSCNAIGWRLRKELKADGFDAGAGGLSQPFVARE